MVPDSQLAAFYIPAFPPARPAPVMQIRTPGGELVDLAAGGRADVAGPRGWDAQLRTMGYARSSRWTSVDDLELGGGPVHMCQAVRAAQTGPSGRPADHLGNGLLPSCTSFTLLTDEQAAKLGRSKFGLHAGDVVECEYIAHHRLPHTGLGQADPRDVDAGVDESQLRWWWLMWHGQEAVLTPGLLCGVEGPVPGNGQVIDPCALPWGHEAKSPHSWQLEAFAPGGASRHSFRPRRRGDIAPRRPGQD
ncbi:hypothetical protein [Jiangella alkaliphila]|uniref:Uncharacterized protein n=1 Tax=Jiangella alkaliphila TaxID=419479 RepID=A0A1H2GCT8_9ACTN|nr:hypothetical protein [Jiangella alkaliphila]SDU17380.1 hypothetical protein SAMN04488563_0425 [Jiangella alkaliphila]